MRNEIMICSKDAIDRLVHRGGIRDQQLLEVEKRS